MKIEARILVPVEGSTFTAKQVLTVMSVDDTRNVIAQQVKYH